MDDLLSRDVKNFKKQHTRRRVWHGILTVLASVVVFVTTYALILPAITMTAAHSHDESCYTQISTIEKNVLACPVMPEDGLLVVHRHDAACYDNGTLVCALPELAEHTHTADCYETPEAHVHTDACYSAARGELLCGLDEDEAHTHTDECYTWETVLSCGQTEDESAEPVLICEQEEVVLHRHDADCYTEDGTLVCTLPEVIAHQHTDSCFELRAVPADTETLTCTNLDPDHVHTALCYGTWVLTCDQGTDEGAQDEPEFPEEPENPTEDEPESPEDPESPEEDETESPEDPESPAEDETESPEDPENPEEDESESPEDPENPEEDETLPENDADTYAASSVSLKYYVYLDGKQHLVLEETADVPIEANTNRHYLTLEQLEAVYDVFGFRAEAFDGEAEQRIFPHTDAVNPSDIWADAPAYQAETDDGTQEWRVPISRSSTSYVYYLPHNTAGHSSYFAYSVSYTNAALISDNSFYTVNVSAPPAASSESAIYYVPGGEDISIALTQFDEYAWSYVNIADGSEITPSDVQETEDGKLLVTFRNVSHPIKIAALRTITGEQSYTIQYHAETLSDCLEQIGSGVYPSAQTVVTDGKVSGMATLTEQVKVTADTVYQLRSPDSLRVITQSDLNRQAKSFIYAFRGWRVKSTGDVLDPAQPLTALQLVGYENGGVIELEAVWSAADANGNAISVNFYIHLYCEIKDFNSNGFTSNPIGDYTQSMFATALLGTETLTFSGNLLVLAPPTTAETAYETDTTLRAMTSTPYNGLTLESFPSDLDMFTLLREKGYTITIDDNAIPLNKLTSDYFQIRWTSLKYDATDGWHVDGVLVAKEAKLRVTKTFLGSDTAIEKIKAQTGDDEYSIQIQNTTHTDANPERLTLVSAEEENRDGCVGYETYDEASNTYTWIAGGRIDSVYQLSEQNYLLGEAHAASYYRISDTVNPGSWQTYDEQTQVTTTMISYAADTPQRRYRTVAFQNAYVEAGMLTLRKLDSFTESGIAAVSFALTSDDGTAQTLYRKPGTSMYTNAHISADADYTEYAGSTLVTDANGDAYLYLTPGSYALRETFPEGYSGAKEIRFTVDGNGTLTALLFDGEAPTTSTGSVSSGVGTALLIAENVSHRLTTVTAVKDWGEVPDEWRQPVTVTLMCDVAPLGSVDSEYTTELSAENNWTYVWEDLPLFIDGKVAEYALQEILIGDTPYNSALQDGYSDYAVTQDRPKYREGKEDAYGDKASWVDENGRQHYANYVLLTVHNRPDGKVGRITVAKRFRSIDNKELTKIDGTYTFALYETSAPDGTDTPVATASVVYGNGKVTPEDGLVRFENLTLDKTYYVFELDDSGRPVPDGETGSISGTPFIALGGGCKIELSSEHPGGEAIITNRINYAELPETGGHGAGIFYVLGAFLTMGAAALLLQKKYRRNGE